MEAITRGLEICADDTVLSIGGSGDQAFAMLEFAQYIEVVEKDQKQADVIIMRLEFLRRSDYENFSYTNEPLWYELLHSGGRKYFTIDRFNLLQTKISNLTLTVQDIFDYIPTKKITKIYLSNILDRKWCKELDSKKFVFLLNCLEPGGLVYITRSYHSLHQIVPKILKLDVNKTKLAGSIEKLWSPLVFAKPV